MNVFEFLSVINAVLVVVMIGIASYKVSQTQDVPVQQIMITPVFLGFGLLVMHTIGFLGSELEVTDITSMAWRLLDGLAVLTIIRLLLR